MSNPVQSVPANVCQRGLKKKKLSTDDIRYSVVLISRLWRCWRCLASGRWYCSCVGGCKLPRPTWMRWHWIYGYGLLADCVTVATDVECHCGRRKREETGERERTVTQGILEEIHSICTYLSGWIPQSRMLKFTSRITNRACNMARCSPLLFLSGIWPVLLYMIHYIPYSSANIFVWTWLRSFLWIWILIKLDPLPKVQY